MDSSMFTTEHLVLRGFEENDLDDLLAFRNDARVMRGITVGPITPRSTSSSKLSQRTRPSGIWITVVHRETGEFMGECGIKVRAWVFWTKSGLMYCKN
ncbi:hypothetical protein DFJ58DRAFT_776996 [Suillus subalutaceus]|uniref:uncharacterized protein n=1 Tax=Suillus subalutaceus TaxID=48586 RepID=UPI001B87B517|nr:uncharacterized protein DFJ58DRAFT_776996 [Suillus subalutaceus]KAG1861779.1 hypothetical protein DFJ58DRAFT_776996 [Suillus subalutaceus]